MRPLTLHRTITHSLANGTFFRWSIDASTDETASIKCARIDLKGIYIFFCCCDIIRFHAGNDFINLKLNPLWWFWLPFESTRFYTLDAVIEHTHWYRNGVFHRRAIFYWFRFPTQKETFFANPAQI
jgi:hypothetical protein